jgi:hypothetical protein
MKLRWADQILNADSEIFAEPYDLPPCNLHETER